MEDVLTAAEEDGWYSNEAATFGDRVAGAREAVSLSQAELARKLGVKLKTVRGWEDDLAEPRANKLQMLAGVLNVSLMWLLTGEGDGLEAPAEGTPAADVEKILTEMRVMKVEMARMTERLGVLEKSLRQAVRG